MKVCQLIPRIGSFGCGVGDYAALLAEGLACGFGIESNFVAVELGPDACKENRSVKQVERRAGTLAEVLDCQQRVLLHYVGYGFQKRGCPVWLLRGLKSWKRRQDGARLTTMFHELYATGLPWQSSFWTSPLQRGICRELARLSDGLVTNRAASAGILKRICGRDEVLNLPVFSNVGEPEMRLPIEDREPRLVVFGGSVWRRKALGEDVEDVRAICRTWGIEEVIEIGPGATPLVELGVPLRKLGALPAVEVSAWMTRSRLGFISYPSSYLEKSGIFAAYAAHGVIPVLPERLMQPDTLGVAAGRHYLSAGQGGNSPSFIEERSRDVFAWYQGHRVTEHARIFADLLKI